MPEISSVHSIVSIDKCPYKFIFLSLYHSKVSPGVLVFLLKSEFDILDLVRSKNKSYSVRFVPRYQVMKILLKNKYQILILCSIFILLMTTKRRENEYLKNINIKPTDPFIKRPYENSNFGMDGR